MFDPLVRKIRRRRDRLPTPVFLGFSCGSTGKEFTRNVGGLGSILGLGRYPRRRNGYPLQYSGLENAMDYSSWGHKDSDMSEQLSLSSQSCLLVTTPSVLESWPQAGLTHCSRSLSPPCLLCSSDFELLANFELFELLTYSFPRVFSAQKRRTFGVKEYPYTHTHMLINVKNLATGD